jgi:hypothetical protein
MKTSRTLAAVFTIGVTVLASACSGADSVAPEPSSDIALVTIQLDNRHPYDNVTGFGEEPDPIYLVANIIDASGHAMPYQEVKWQLQSTNGASVSDTIATFESIGTQTATVIRRRKFAVTLQVVASVTSSDGSIRKGSLFIAWPSCCP